MYISPKQIQIRRPGFYVDFGPTKCKHFEFILIFAIGLRFSFGFEIWRRGYSE